MYLIGKSHLYSLDSGDTAFQANDNLDLLKLHQADYLYSNTSGSFWKTDHELKGEASVFHLGADQTISDYPIIPAVKQMGAPTVVHVDERYLWVTGENSILRLERWRFR